MLGIVLATGLVVDDGIVVTENIYKKLEGGMDKMTAAREGSKEIYFAVISTSITLAVVFYQSYFSRDLLVDYFASLDSWLPEQSLFLLCVTYTHAGTERETHTRS